MELGVLHSSITRLHFVCCERLRDVAGIRAHVGLTCRHWHRTRPVRYLPLLPVIHLCVLRSAYVRSNVARKTFCSFFSNMLNSVDHGCGRTYLDPAASCCFPGFLSSHFLQEVSDCGDLWN